MKTTKTLRWLSLLGFLLLMAPFYDACDGNYIHQVNADGKAIKINKPLKTKIYDFVVDEESFSAIEIAETTFNGRFKEITDEMIRVFKERDWKNLSIFVSVIFDFIVLISLSILILSFTKRKQTLHKLTLINTILILFTLLYILFLESSFDHIRQIKWGYYAFILTNLLLFYYSKPHKIKT
jgi:hypothetical protein